LTRRPVAALAAMLAGLAATGAGLGTPAHAQVGYPPGPCTATVNTTAAGTLRIGATVTITLTPLCAFTVGGAVNVTVNGLVVATKVATAGGTVSITVTALSATTLSIDDPVLVPAVCGPNTVTGVGPSAAANAMVTQTVSFGLDCTTVAAQTVSRGFLSFTGANILRWSAIALGAVVVGGLIVGATRRWSKAASRA